MRSQHAPRCRAAGHACALTRVLRVALLCLPYFCAPCAAGPGDPSRAASTATGGLLRAVNPSAGAHSAGSTHEQGSRRDLDEAPDYGDGDAYAGYTDYSGVDPDTVTAWDADTRPDIGGSRGVISGRGDAVADGDADLPEPPFAWGGVGHGCHSCRCLPRCHSGRCNIVRPCKTKRCTGHCKWPRNSRRGRPIGACRLGNCSRLDPGYVAPAADGMHASEHVQGSE